MQLRVNRVFLISKVVGDDPLIKSKAILKLNTITFVLPQLQSVDSSHL